MMSAFSSVALVSAHPPIPAFLNYGISDLTELAGLASFVKDVVEDIAIPVGPTDRDPIAGFSRFIRVRRPQLVGISAFTCGARSALDYARIAKDSGAYVVVGGYHPSALPDEMLRCPHIDAVVRGEGEETFRDLVVNGPSRDVRGLSFRDQSGVAHNPDRPLIEDLDRLPLPLRAIRPPRFGLDGLDYHVDSIYTSRGCRGRCTFCANHLVGKRWRQRSIRHVMEELATIAPGRRRTPKMVKMWDASFMTDTARVAELCEELIAEGLNRRFRFVAETRIDDILRGREILGLMKEAGFVKLGTGVESPNRDTLRRVRKGVVPEAVEEAARLVAASGISFSKFFIIGHEQEGLESILDYAEFAVSPGLPRQSAYFFVMTPYPGTGVFDSYREKGLIKSDDWDLYTNYGAVIEQDGVSQLTLQTLVGVLPIQYSLGKRFARGEPFAKLAAKVMALILASAKVFQGHRSTPRAAQLDGIWQGLELLREVPPRQPTERHRKRLFRNLALRFFHGDHRPVTIMFSSANDAERMTIIREAGRASRPRRTLTINLSLALLYRLAEVIDPRRAGHDVITLLLRPSALRPSWAMSLLGQTVRVGGVLATMAGFHLRRSIGSG